MKNKNTIGLLGVHVFFFTLDVFISTFLIAKVFVLTNKNIAIVALFNLLLLTVLFLTFTITSYIVRKIKCVHTLRISVILNVILIGLIIIFIDKLEAIFYYLGILNGISMGMYWGSMHSLASKLIKKDDIPKYSLYAQISFSLSKIIFPLTLGFLIDYISFEISAWFTLIAGVIVIAFSLLIKEDNIKLKSLSIKTYFKEVKEIKKGVYHNYFIQFLYGAYSNSISLSITILIMVVLDSNFSLGMFSSLFSLLAICLLLLYRAIKKVKIKNGLFYISLILPIVLSSFILFITNEVTLVLFVGSYLVFSSIVRAESDGLRLNIMKIFNKEDIINESNIIIELVYVLARMFSFGLLIIIYHINVNLFAPFVIIMLGLLLTSGILIKSWYQKYQLNNTV